MLTLFTTGKSFVGHSGLIQRNALKSWTLLHPDVEVILFGDDEGATEIAAELGIRHEVYVERNSYGSKRLDYMFDRAQEIARHDILCYLNCDILLLRDFLDAVARLKSWNKAFLMVGRRWDTDIRELIDFSALGWETELRKRAVEANDQRPAWWIDYFVFSRGLYAKKIPALVIGRVFWDNWLIWKAETLGADLVDASPAVIAIHQNHDYGYHPKGKEGVWTDEQSQRNFVLAGGHANLRTMESARYFLMPHGLKPNLLGRFGYFRMTTRRVLGKAHLVSQVQKWFWYPILNVTRPLRTRLGLRK